MEARIWESSRFTRWLKPMSEEGAQQPRSVRETPRAPTSKGPVQGEKEGDGERRGREVQGQTEA